jgi:hypothetical protein
MSNKKVSWLITDNNITVNYDGQTHIVARTDALADHLIKAVKEKKLDEIPNLVSTAKRIENFSKGTFVVQDGEILVNGIPAPAALGNKIIKFSNEGLPYEPLVKFAANLQRNPSFRSVNELFQFLEKNDHPLTENGNFIAYKKVRSNFTDCHTGTFDNSVGTVVSMARNQVDEDSNRTCSNGLHVANWDYANNFYGNGSGIMLEVEVDPADVVAVPTDYNQAKMRVCKYKVLGVVDHEHSSDMGIRYTEPQVDDTEEEEEDEECVDCEGCEGCGGGEFCSYCGEFDCYGECEDD